MLAEASVLIEGCTADTDLLSTICHISEERGGVRGNLPLICAIMNLMSGGAPLLEADDIAHG